MNRTFTDMKSNVGNNIQDTSSAMSTIIGRYLNDTYFDLLRRINWENIDHDYSFSTVAGTQDYVLPSNFGKEVYVHDSTNKIQLSHIGIQELVDVYSTSLTSQGNPQRYTIIKKAVQNQPSSASTLSIVSSSSADTTQTVYVRGISSGVEVTESVTLTGTTPVATTNSYTEIVSISKSLSSTGGVTITSNSGAVTVAVIPPDILDYKVKCMRLHLVPNGVAVINCPYIIHPQPLLNDYDTPLVDFADVIEDGATAKAWRYKRQFAKAQEWERLYEKAINHIVWDKENQPNQVKLFNPKPYSRDIC